MQEFPAKVDRVKSRMNPKHSKGEHPCAEDGVVAEMLQQLDEDVLDLIALVFKARLLNLPSASADTSWATYCVDLVRKKPNTCTIRD